MALNKPIAEVMEKDLLDLISNSVSEGKDIEYKKELVGNTRDEKKEFLADVSSFANASGGFLIFGINEEAGIAKDLIGIQNVDADAEILRLENIIRDGIEPRVFGITIKSIKLTNNNIIFLLFIPNSWAKPHVVNFSSHWRFYTRNSAGKYPLDISEVRSMFLASDTAIQKIKNFRMERISNICAGETPIELSYSKDSFIILHLIPLSSFEISARYDFNELLNSSGLINPLNSNGYNYIINFDGILSYTPVSNTNKAYTYLQVFRNGIIEAVDTSALNFPRNGVYGIPGAWMRKNINEKISKVLKIYKKYQIQPPFFIMLSLIGVKDYIIWADPSHFLPVEKRKIDRNNLFLPEVLLADYDSNINDNMKITYDSMWNAAGWDKAYE